MKFYLEQNRLSQLLEPMEIKKSTGIPRSFMVPVEGPQVQGAMMTPNGSYAVPVLDHQTYTQKQPAPPPVQEEQPDIPEDLICSICSGLLTDAVMIPCCGNSFCDECIRGCLLESEEHECPDCHERDISPGTLIPNRYLRNSVANFKNTTGYVKKPMYKPIQTLQQTPQTEIEKKEEASKTTTLNDSESVDAAKTDPVEKTIISEADSTEPPKNVNVDFSKDIDVNETAKESPSKSSVSEGPPGVSPRREKSPKRPTARRGSHSSTTQNNVRPRHSSKDVSSPRHHPTRRTPPYEPMSRIEERPGTPTVDEPGGSNVGNNVYPPTSAPYPSAPPPGVLPPMIGMPPPHMQGPPPNYPPGQPPPGVFSNQGPPPNFRLPPPGTNPSAPFVPGPYNAPPRPIFDSTRPPIQGPPPNYQNYPPRSRNRDFRDSSRLRARTPPGIIDDPLEAFNRMLREKDERDRRAKQKKGRSYSRSSSRSYSRSPKRPRSRTPRRRNSRSRSRSFSMSRSRSRSFSPSPRNSPYRDYSPRNSSPRRRPPSRFRSPARSPPPRYRYKDGPINDRNRDRDFDRPPPQRDRDRGYSRDRDYNFYDRGERGAGRWGGGSSRPPPPPMQDNYYPQEVHQLQPPPPTNRYPPRDNYQPYSNKNEPPPHHMAPIMAQPTIHPPPAPPQRRFEDIAPPGTDQPPIPGEELPSRYEERYPYQQDQPVKDSRFSNDRDVKNKDEDRRNYESKTEDKGRRFDRYSRSPRKSRERHVESPDKHKRKRREHSEERDNRDKRDERHDRKNRDNISDDEKSKRSKDKKKKREKKEMEKKKRKEKKEKKEQDKAKKEDKDKKRETNENDAAEKLVVKEKDDKKDEKRIEVNIPKVQEIIKVEKTEEKPDLYDDLLSDGVDKSIMKNYGKLDAIIKQDEREKTPEITSKRIEENEFKEENEYPPESETSKDEDVLDIHANEAELKAELEKSEVLAPLPEKSKWEIDEDLSTTSIETQKEGKQDRNGKVTTEVLKRAENAIFAKAINAIRPIEIKKISMDRAKLYSGEKEKDRKGDEQDIRNIQVTISSSFDEEIVQPSTLETVKVESEIQKPPPRLSVKERLGVKVDDLERIVKVSYDRNRSRSLSPLSKRARDERLHVDRRMDDRGRHERDRYHRSFRNLDRTEFRRREEFLRRERERRDEMRRDERSRSRKDEVKRKRTRSRSESKEHKHRKKDKKQKKEKIKKHKREDKDDSKSKDEVKVDKRETSLKPKSATDRRKPTLDEANFEPDYDLESESEKEDVKKSPKEINVEDEKRRINKAEDKEKESSSSDSSSSSSEDDRKRKKHRKHKKKKSRKETSSSSSSSDTDSSEEERERRNKKELEPNTKTDKTQKRKAFVDDKISSTSDKKMKAHVRVEINIIEIEGESWQENPIDNRKEILSESKYNAEDYVIVQYENSHKAEYEVSVMWSCANDKFKWPSKRDVL
ncbi:retinoblastoma-binding protein 6 [Holotrichia oblita]|uniref:Retinoblastoma-binding protein 6 n=1 Tax=Holotrichia oblita TaxID=644536 RepID=A0ACB9SP61_HOLOL|nr:retinoblastoma-binding protein 6 [Holotrichia oblita]